MGWDFAIVETGNGGDLTMRGGSDIQVYYADENEIYLRMCGGNIEQDTPQKRQTGDEDLSYWANKLLYGNDPSIQFNSLTERTLKRIQLNSAGLKEIENAVKKDLEGLTVTVAVSIAAVDRVKITIIHTLDNGAQKQYVFTYVKSSHVSDFDLSDFSAIDFN